MTTYTVTFDSGAFSYSNTGNVIDDIIIGQTKADKYQSATVILHGVSNIFTIGMDVNINVNGVDLFSGYISEIKITSEGTRKIILDLVGKTFNLWKDIIP